MPNVSAWPVSRTLDRAREALGERVGDGLVDEHARGGRALLPRVAEGRRDDRRDGVVEVGVGVDETQFLPPISATTRLSWRWPSGVSPAASRISRPTGAEPVKAIVAMSGCADERGAGVALAGEEVDGVGRDAASRSASTTTSPHAGRLLGRLEHDRVAGDERGGDHARRDREREVPRGDDRA